MRYQIRHTTRYLYDHVISVSHHLVRTHPRNLPNQNCLEFQLTTSPNPTSETTHQDYFGNTTSLLTIEGPHQEFSVTATSQVDRQPSPPPNPGSTPPWETIRDQCLNNHPSTLEAIPFLFPSPMIPRSPKLADLARPFFSRNRPWIDALTDFMNHVHQTFSFDPTATQVTTKVETVLTQKRGVCQDFAHLTIAALRSLDLPARYVSGYLETLPPPGQPKLTGADASHAWISAFLPNVGWIDLDPTNNLFPSSQHITVAFGRDFQDVSPVRGVLVGAGNHQLSVAVDVQPITPTTNNQQPTTKNP
jgi:transglutaminase-like putative cysteine protease